MTLSNGGLSTRHDRIHQREKRQAADSSTQRAPTSTPAHSNVSPLTTTAATGAASMSPNPAIPGTPRLSAAAIAGIVVAATFIALLLIAVLFYIYLRRQHMQGKRSKSSPKANPYAAHYPSGSKIHSMAAFSVPIAPEKPAPIHIPREIQPARDPVYELGAGQGREKMATAEGGKIRLDTEAARFGRGLGVEDDLESPVDGTSPFRLKRGNTLPKGKKRDAVAAGGKRSSKLRDSRVCEDPEGDAEGDGVSARILYPNSDFRM